MREIKFRGRQTIDRVGTWRYGFFQAIPNAKYASIVGFNEKDNIESWRVDHETVGQFTGLHDKNGVEIYEGDVVRTTHKYNKDVVEGSVYFEDYQWFGARDYLGYIAEYCDIEIIGNIHNKPELVEVTE